MINYDKILPSTPKALELAQAQLQLSNLIAIPTETVYGLAANAYDNIAVAKIYQAKQRPSFNPLIIHYNSLKQITQDAIINNDALKLINTIKQGAISYILPKKKDSKISPLASCGLDTIAVRIPHNRTTQNLLKNLNFPLAAPSANISGSLSPTTAQHVAQSLHNTSQLTYIIDDGACNIGIESTILDLSSHTPTILRAGYFSPAFLENILEKKITFKNEAGPSIIAPGMLKSHYKPNTPLRINVSKPQNDEVYIGFKQYSYNAFINLSKDGNLLEAASKLFEALHLADALKAKQIAIAPIPQIDIGIAINERLIRASTRNN